MKIEISSAKNISIDIPENIGSIFAIHGKAPSTANGETADCTAFDITNAIKKDLLPVLFLDFGIYVMPCRIGVYDSENNVYEFRCELPYDEKYKVFIDGNGKINYPR